MKAQPTMEIQEGSRPDWLAQFENEPSIVYILDSAFRLSYCNASWDRFALENGGSHLLRKTQVGIDVMEITPEPLRAFYSALYLRVLESGEETDHVYECSSGEKFRLFRMLVRRADSHLVVINSLALEQEYQDPGFRSDSQALVDQNGIVTMCCHCRKTRILNAVDSWVRIPAFVNKMPPLVSHGICSDCFSAYYADFV
jgi:hypothetical protein